MGISLKTHKLLWGKSANRCAICKIELYEDITEIDDEALIGEECHIVAQKEDGPRGKSELSLEERDKLNNLILLCRNHHKIVDTQVHEYTVEKLTQLKISHEQYVKNTFSVQQDKELMDIISTLDELFRLARFDNWDNSFAGITYTTSLSINKDFLKDLETLDEYLFRRFRVPKYENIEKELDNFKHILKDFLNTFRKYIDFSLDSPQHEEYYTSRFYKIREYNEEKYDLLLNKYNYHSDLLEDLIFELTRSANRLIDLTRKEVFHSYRQKQGYLIIHRGMEMDLKERTFLLRYKSDDEIYHGLKKYVLERSKRSHGIGTGNDFIEDYI